MKKLLTWIVALSFFMFCGASVQAEKIAPSKAAFIRGSNLWIKVGDEEKQITKEGGISTPKWSYDGQWIAYQKKEKEIWVYHVQRNKHYQVFYDGSNYQWAPTKNTLAFQAQSVLNISEIQGDQPKSFENISVGIDNFTWIPDSSGFIASTGSQLLPDGWTSPILYRIPLPMNGEGKQPIKFFTIPQPVSNGKVEMLAINVSAFSWSYDGRWLSFIVTPTASLSADGNMFCLLSSDGKIFKAVELMLNNENWVGWAPTQQKVAFIAGEGRMSTENKKLTILDVPSMQLKIQTPASFADRDVTWQNDTHIIVARSKESEWNTEPSQRPLPSLYQINLQDNKQSQITNPPASYGDFNPQAILATKQLSWIRTDRKTAAVLLANDNGADAKVWISSIDIGTDYYELWRWDSVFDLYKGKSS